MKYGNLILCKDEYNSLMRAISISTNNGDKTYKSSLDKLRVELKSARMVDHDDVPKDVIRFNSFVTIYTSFNVERCYQIVVPEKSNIQQNRISILSPMGLALLGYANGDSIMWQFPSGVNEIKIIGVAQQEIHLKKVTI
ncbi:GreA/GreB family elongation factor [Flavobacterium degerlachei]|uniref:Regulator of nucleoside diphosphate kinase n=1 Tax=Flavobacterium degerlachei TaxID=229203 RepID=A0A1H3DRP8_9FLAO|nr:GreA/GreB family elongation factor [Flavobacterium degerlachei]SDX69202.1 regulator of nucleoside diphosphate kinase [Flavobacterium degerlachei]